MGETTILAAGSFPGVESIEDDWFPSGICFDSSNFILSARELFQATLKMRQQIMPDSQPENECKL